MREAEVREARARWGSFPWPEFPPMFLERLQEEDFEGATVLDVGTGEGRLALLLAPRAERVVGIDVDRDALARARSRAASLGVRNVTFVPGDADASDYRSVADGPVRYVVASYFMSRMFLRASARALVGGGKLLFACHHADHWTETGRRGRFAFGEDEMREELRSAGLDEAFLGVDRLVFTYASLAQLAEAHPTLLEKFRRNGRWEALRARYPEGEVTLTWATLVGVAVAPV